jgi:hypothetical protein
MESKSNPGLQVLSVTIRTIFFMVRTSAQLMGAIFTKMAHLMDEEKREEKSKRRTMAQYIEREAENRSPIRVHSSADFQVADRIHTIRLEPSVAVIHLRVYQTEKVVKRDIVITEPKLRTLLQGRRHSLPDAKLKSLSSMEDIKEESVQLAQTLINAKGNQAVKKAKVQEAPAKEQPKPKAEEKVQEKVQQQVQAKAPPAVQPVAPPPPPPPPAPAPQPQMQQAQPERPREAPRPNTYASKPQQSSSYVPNAPVGVAFEGELVAAGSRRIAPEGRPSYEIFECKVHVGNGVDVPLRGAELERELERLDIQVGERVSITPMGKVPITLADGRPGSKNVYRVARLEGVGR